MAMILSERLTLVRTLALFYLVIIILLATLTALGTHLQSYADASTPIYIAWSAVHLYINGLSIIFVLYLFYTLHRAHKCDVMLPVDSPYNLTGKPVPVLLENGHPVSRYQRSALAAFGLVAVILDGVYIVEAIQNENTVECRGEIYVVVAGFRLVLNICIALFILKHHKIIINTNVPALKWGFVHLIATMLSDYITMIIVEAYEGFVHGSESHSEDDHAGNSTTESPHAEVGHHVQKRESSSICFYDSSLLSNQLLPYMLPFVIEFVLLGAAILYKNLNQIGMPVTKEMLNVKYIPMSDKLKLMVGSSIVSTIVGWILLLGTAAGTIYVIYVAEDDEATTDTQQKAMYVYFAMQLVLNVIGMITIVLAAIYLSDIPFLGHAHSVIDQAVLIVTIFGFYLLHGFTLLPNLASFSLDGFFGELSKLGTFDNLLSYIEGSMQFLFIMDAFRRGSQPLWKKNTLAPNFVSILFYINFGLWLVSSFVVKRNSENSLMTDYYGSLTWNIVIYTTLPLGVFFRFHSTVCLVDILVEIWMPDKIE